MTAGVFLTPTEEVILRGLVANRAFDKAAAGRAEIVLLMSPRAGMRSHRATGAGDPPDAEDELNSATLEAVAERLNIYPKTVSRVMKRFARVRIRGILTIPSIGILGLTEAERLTLTEISDAGLFRDDTLASAIRARTLLMTDLGIHRSTIITFYHYTESEFIESFKWLEQMRKASERKALAERAKLPPSRWYRKTLESYPIGEDTLDRLKDLADGTPPESLRAQMILLSLSGSLNATIAKAVGVHTSTVAHWRLRFTMNGVDGLKTHTRESLRALSKTRTQH